MCLRGRAQALVRRPAASRVLRQALRRARKVLRRRHPPVRLSSGHGGPLRRGLQAVVVVQGGEQDAMHGCGLAHAA